jgi:hypothetical protein
MRQWIGEIDLWSLCCIFGKYVLKKNILQKISIFFLIAVLLFGGSFVGSKRVCQSQLFQRKKTKTDFFSLLNVGGLVRN